ncbi:MAG: TonB-dependent receptor plug domain-containing protein, partial [Chitinophagaceae bacterium]|nr:TonB-dependent receptor plug domain-containing protein [Chitinophagaceae bacterium]
MIKYFKTALFLFLVTTSFAQNDSILVSKDSLQNLTVKGFYSNAKWKDAAAAISILNEKKLQQFSPNSLVPAINAVAGVRMEERSPGSYRLSIRGSLLRSPFGVRNIKIYWNDLPLSDGGGNTYLNLLEMQHLTGAEILKGPAASVYGANTGGAVLLKSDLPFAAITKNLFEASINGGSYNLLAENISWRHQQQHFAMQLQQSHQKSDGYREQSALRKDVLQWNANFQDKNNQFSLLAFYTNLHYQTPGGITESQMLVNPKLSRQATASLPSAKQQQTGIYNSTLFAGINHNLSLNKYFNVETSVTANTTSIKNPFITNYEKRAETNLGLRTKLIYQHQFKQLNFQWITGAEWLSNHAKIDDYGNRNGVQDTVQFKDDIFANQWFAFVQVQLSFLKFNVNVGVSINEQLYRYRRLPQASFLHSSTNMIAAPRLALLYKLSNDISLYSLAAKGFSPPSLAEVHPSDGNFYSSLQPEYGWNLEAGIKGNILNDKLMFDVAFYYFKLQDAIVRRNNSAGTEYFINAGSTIQKGVEVSFHYQFLDNKAKFVSSLSASNSFSYQPYTFNDYFIGGTNYSGNKLTGVPKTINVSTIEVVIKNHFYTNIIFNYTSSIPLTDANDVYANDYRLLQLKMGYRFIKTKTTFHLFAGIDNALNQLYSLGNDINALG